MDKSEKREAEGGKTFSRDLANEFNHSIKLNRLPETRYLSRDTEDELVVLASKRSAWSIGRYDFAQCSRVQILSYGGFELYGLYREHKGSLSQGGL